MYVLTDHIEVGASSSKAGAKKTKLHQKSIKHFFKKIEFDDTIQALRLSAVNNDNSTQGINSATTVVNIVTAGNPEAKDLGVR